MKEYTFNAPIVQARNKEEAKRFLEDRIKALLLHPDGIDDILELDTRKSPGVKVVRPARLKAERT